jgi:hypothetical protein
MPTGKSSNRTLWMFRGLFALVAVLLLALILLHSSPGPTADADWLKLTEGRGRTAQGASIAMRFDRPAHPLALETSLRARCANGSSWGLRWSPFDGTAARFRRERRGLRVVEISARTYGDGTFGQNVLSMRATLGPGARQVRGWVRLTVAFSRANGWSTTCDSGRVPFAIDAPLAPARATSARPS